jgi:hypothetical protein
MMTSGFWIRRHPAPDQVILSSENIKQFNNNLRARGLTVDLTRWPDLKPGEDLRVRLRERFSQIKSDNLVLLDGISPAAVYWSDVKETLNLDVIPVEIKRQYGLVVEYADQRFLPVREGLYARAHDVDFDELQNSALDIGTPVVVEHYSRDGQWVFVTAASSSGWVETQRVALADFEEARPFVAAPFMVVTAPKTDLYADSAMTDFQGSARMGTRLVLVKEGRGSAVAVMLPRRGLDGRLRTARGFVPAEDVRRGYLDYTARHILRQAFKMLHQPYGWGGMYGAQDCSRFLQEVYATVGIELPRDSKDQIQAGELLAAWEGNASTADKQRLLEKSAVGGVTVLGMKGHIMIYLGAVDGRAYAVHGVWAYRRPGRGDDAVVVLNRVVVSDLTLGEGSKRGSLLERLNMVKMMR